MIKEFLIRFWKDESGGDSFGRLALGLVGAGIGFAIGGPFGAAAFGAQLGFLGGTIVGNILFPQELPDIEGQRLDPNQSMTSSYGNPIAIGYGRFVVGGTLVYYPGFVEHMIEEEVGGKGAPTQTVRSFTYTGDFRVNCCEGPVGAILKIWMNRKLVFDATGTGGDQIINWTEISEAPGEQAIRKYLGTEIQEPDVTEVADKGVDATPAYRGQAGAFFQDWPLDEYGGIPPQVTMLISSAVTVVLSATTHVAGWLNVNIAKIPGTNLFAIGGSNPSIIFDNGSRRTLGTIPVSGDPEFPIVDDNGNMWSLNRSRTFKKFSIKTLQQIGSSTILIDPQNGGSFGDNSLAWNDHIVFGGTVTLEGNRVGERLAFFETPSPAWCVIDLDNWASEFGGVIQTSVLPTGANIISRSLIKDNEGFGWFMIKTDDTLSDHATLNRINPGSGLVDLVYELDDSYSELSYDRWANNLIIHKFENRMIQFSLDSGMETARLVYDTFFPIGDKNRSLWRDGCNPNGDMYLQVGDSLGTVQRFNVRGEMFQSPDDIYNMSGDFGLSSTGTQRGFFDITRNAMVKMLTGPGDLAYLYVGAVGEGDLITVQSIVDDVSERIGLSAADRDTTALTDQLHGYLIGRRTPAKSILSPLSQMFFFNPVSEDFQIKFVKLGGASVATIPEDDLGANKAVRGNTDDLAEEFIQEIELPEVLELGYSNPKAEYQPQYQRSKRPRSTTNTKRQKRLAFPGSFVSNTDAKRRLDSILYNVWTKRLPVSFQTSHKWMRLSPADVVTVTYEGATRDVALGAVDIGANNVLEFKGAADDPDTLISFSIGGEGDQGRDEQVLVILGPNEFFVLDIPLLRSLDDGFGVYLAAGPFCTGVTFTGSNIIQSSDDITYGPFGFVSRTRAATHGFSTQVLAGGVDANLWDRTSSYTVQILFGTLASSTEDDVLNGANLALIGNELVSFVTAVDNGSGSYTLSTLLRGRLGTEGEIDNHVVSENFVFVDSTTFVRRAMEIEQLDTSLFYRGVTLGQTIKDSLRKTIAVQGKSQWGWAVAHVFGSITADDWTLGWTRRSRFSAEWKNLAGTDAIIVDSWEVDILDAPGGTVVATYTNVASANGSVTNTAGNSFFYDNNDQIADLGGVQTTVTFVIYAMEGVVGRGFPSEVTLIEG